METWKRIVSNIIMINKYLQVINILGGMQMQGGKIIGGPDHPWSPFGHGPAAFWDNTIHFENVNPSVGEVIKCDES